MKSSALGITDKERDLGTVLCSYLKWNYQATLAVNRATMVLGQLSRAFNCWTVSSFKKLYVGFISL